MTRLQFTLQCVCVPAPFQPLLAILSGSASALGVTSGHCRAASAANATATFSHLSAALGPSSKTICQQIFTLPTNGRCQICFQLLWALSLSLFLSPFFPSWQPSSTRHLFSSRIWVQSAPICCSLLTCVHVWLLLICVYLSRTIYVFIYLFSNNFSLFFYFFHLSQAGALFWHFTALMFSPQTRYSMKNNFSR